MLQDLKEYTRWALRIVFVVYMTIVFFGALPIARDDTDPGLWGARSGMSLYTDALTGCQYLSAGTSGITPRLNKEGAHVGCK